MQADIMQADIVQADIIDILKGPRAEEWFESLKSVTNAEKVSLLFLADRGEGTMYNINKEKGIYYSVVHDAFKRLCERRWIRKERDEKSARNVLRTVYRPTMAGLLYAFIKNPENPNIFKKVKERFPWLFGKAELFERHGIQRILANFFVEKVDEYLRSVERGHTEKELEIKRESLSDLFGDLYLENANHERDLMLKITKAVVEDRELCRLVRPWAKGYRNLFLREADLLDRVLNMLEPSNLRRKNVKRRR